MNLLHLCSVPNVNVHFDTWNNWLYLEWDGKLTLPAIQHACLAIAHCFVAYTYPRVLNNNAHLMGVEWEVAPWLAQHFLPHLGLAGIEQMAWVHAPSLHGRSPAEHVLRHVGPQVNVALFNDVEDAVRWLQQTRPSPMSGYPLLPRPAHTDAKLTRLIQRLEQAVVATPARPVMTLLA